MNAKHEVDAPLPADVTIGGRAVGPGRPAFVVAEIGTAHGGDLDVAREMIDRAAACGADCAKFQLVIAEEIVHPKTGLVTLPGGQTPLFDVFRRMERSVDFYRRLKEVTEERGLVFLCSVFGLGSADMLFSLGSGEVKIASPELNHLPLLDRVASSCATAIVSTGVSRLGDIEAALERLGPSTVLLHCVTAYPAPPGEYNLRVLRPLSTLFGVNVGVSDHSTDPLLIPSLAVMQGAIVIEKHFTLSRRGGGLDDPVALIPEDFARMVSCIRRVEQGGGAAVTEQLRRSHGENRILEALGDGAKCLAASERGNYETTNRSIIATASIRAGDTLDESRIALLRSEKNIEPGIAAEHWPVVLGSIAVRDIPDGRGIRWGDILRSPRRTRSSRR